MSVHMFGWMCSPTHACMKAKSWWWVSSSTVLHLIVFETGLLTEPRDHSFGQTAALRDVGSACLGIPVLASQALPTMPRSYMPAGDTASGPQVYTDISLWPWLLLLPALWVEFRETSLAFFLTIQEYFFENIVAEIVPSCVLVLECDTSLLHSWPVAKNATFILNFIFSKHLSYDRKVCVCMCVYIYMSV